MSFKAILYAYVLGGLTFIPLVILGICFYAVYTSVPVGDPNVDKIRKAKLEQRSQEQQREEEAAAASASTSALELNDLPKTRKGWLTVRRTFEETPSEGTYVGFVRGLLGSRSKDPKRSRPKDMWYVVLKGKILYLYEDESMVDCEAAVELSGHDVVIYPEGLLDGELFAKRNAIMLKPKVPPPGNEMPSVTKEMISTPDFTDKVIEKGGSESQKQRDRERAKTLERKHEEARQEALERSTPWFIFVKSNVEMEDWYLAFIHASDNPPNSSTLAPLEPVFHPTDMFHLVSTLDEQPDVIPMRWLNALLGRIFFSHYRTQNLESYIIGRLMKKLSKVKRPGFLTDLSVREVSVGNRAPTFSKPMLKELTKEGDASLEVHLQYKGEIRITVDATATVNLGARFKSYTVKLVLAAVLRELEGNLLVKVKRPPSNRIWYAFTQMPRMVLDVEPVVSDRQITWGMILGTIESKLKEVIQESVVLPNMDDIAFFETGGYKHRGGIWADASRTERAPELFSNDVASTEDDQLPASTPASGTSTPLSTDIDHIPIQRSHSEPLSEVPSSPEVKDTSSLPRATTVATSAPASNGSSAKRRTWFGTPKEDDAEGLGPSRRGVDEYMAPLPSGQSIDGIEPLSRQASQKSSSSSDSTDSHPRTPHFGEGEDNTVEQKTPIIVSSPPYARSEAHAQDDSPPSSNGSVSTSPSESLLSAFRPKNLSPQQPNSPTFFQTLKSRDKQAISNTAKETIRKWGANWGLNKKGDAGSGEESTDGEQRGNRSRPNSGYGGFQATVEQRGIHQNARSSLLDPTFHPTYPIDIRQARRPRDASPADSSSTGNGSYIGTSFEEPNPLSSSPRPLERAEPRQGKQSISELPVSPPALPPRGRTISSQPQHGLEGLNPPSEDEHPPRPIHTQPLPPKTMMIPGIHARHRGEVMSIGYAPPPPPVEQKKAPALQNVYRLWKSPSETQEETGNSASTSAQPDTSAAATPPSRPIPPPLPPRSYSTHAVQLTSEPPLHPPELDKMSPPATAALQSIVSKDRSQRASLEPTPRPDEAEALLPGTETPTSSAIAVSENRSIVNVPPKPTPPALPPRRAPTMAI